MGEIARIGRCMAGNCDVRLWRGRKLLARSGRGARNMEYGYLECEQTLLVQADFEWRDFDAGQAGRCGTWRSALSVRVGVQEKLVRADAPAWARAIRASPEFRELGPRYRR